MTQARASRALPALLVALLTAQPALAGLPKVPEGFEVRLVANVPAVIYPCQVATAPDGALYIAVDPMDQVGPYESDHGKIWVVRDGQEPTVYAEGFRAIFGMAWHDNALYVSHMPYLSVLRDTNGDGKADSRQDLYKDLGITNNSGLNDHIVSGLQFGMDGYLYVSVGDKGVLKATGPDGKTAQIIGGGTLRMRPDGTGIEVVTTGTRNHLEPNLDARDNLFTYDNTDDGLGWWTRVTHHVDGGYYGYPYDYHDHPSRFLNRIAEYGGGSPCGGLVYKEDAWPEAYRGRVFWAEWGKRKVSGFRFEPDGAGFKVANVIELAEPGDAGEFRPLDVALSYDGKTLYVADWGMGGWGSKTEKVGRVYAITYKGAPITTRPRGQDSDPLDAQFRQLDHPSWNERMRAQTAIIKAGRKALPLVVQALADPKTDPLAARHLVWVVDGITGGGPEGLEPLVAALTHPVADVRAQSARALGERRVKAASPAIQAVLGDPEPSVRLQAIIALGRIGEPSSVAALLPILLDGDRTLAFSARQALRRIGDWPAVAAGLRSENPRLRAAVLDALELVYQPSAVATLKQVVTDASSAEADRVTALLELAEVHRQAPPWDGKWWGTRPAAGKPPARTVAWEGTPAVIATIREELASVSAPLRIAAIAAVRSTGDRDLLPALRERFRVETEPRAKREVALALGEFQDKEALPLLIAALRDPGTPDLVRDAALSGIEATGGPLAIEALVDVLARQGSSLAAERQSRVIAALGRFKARAAVKTLVEKLASPDAEVRTAAAEALGAIGEAKGVAEKVRPLLGDSAVPVRKAAIAALAELNDRPAIPGLIAAANDEPTRFEATLALATLPDPRALQVYLRGITDKSPDVRKAASRAIVAIRDEARPALERLAARHELSPASLPELRKIFGSLQPILDWHVMGPFPINDRPPVQLGKPINLAGTAPGPDGKELTWQAVKGEGVEGMVDLGRLYSGNTDERSAFATVELECPVARPAQMAFGSDDTLNVWLNGREVYKFNSSRGYEPDVARVDVELRKGKNQILVKCGNHGGLWQFSVSVTGSDGYAFLQGPVSGGYDPDRFRAEASRGQGKADHGKALFFDLKGLACSKCHVVAGQGGAIGPELSGIAAKYPREELIASVLYPSAKISSGYEPAVVALNDGRVLTGLVKSDTPEALEIEDADAKRIKIPKADIEDRKQSDVSLMPNGIVEGLSAADFADLIAYLETLKDASANQGKPGVP
jgi:putative membrane-bound dehydrogenase-like protein